MSDGELKQLQEKEEEKEEKEESAGPRPILRPPPSLDRPQRIT